MCSSDQDCATGHRDDKETLVKMATTNRIKRKNGKIFCEADGCETRASFAEKGASRPRFCKKHVSPGMDDVVSKKCATGGCNKNPSYGLEGTNLAKYCARCAKNRKDGHYVDFRKKKCIMCKVKCPCFNFERGKPLYCKKCSENFPGMVDVRNRKCEFKENGEKCTKQPSYGFPGDNRATRCFEHRLEGSEDIRSKKCKHPLCGKQPIYNLPGKRGAEYCWDHKTLEMEVVWYRRCQKCHQKSASFNFPGQKCPIRCTDCKEGGMENVVSPRCLADGCTKKRQYNIEGEPPMWCAVHAKAGMISLITRCQCGTMATYGYLGKQPEACARCRKRRMVFKPRKRCEECQKDFAMYGPSVYKRVHCSMCRIEESDREFVNQRCIQCNEIDVVSNEGLCYTCDPVNFYIFRKARELEVKAWLDANGLQDHIYDRTLDGGECTKQRPDFIFECVTHKLILEVDEDQHRDYEPGCDYTRMCNIAQANGMPTIFIRYNPDGYRDASGKKQDDTTYRRRQTLLEWVNHLRKPIDRKVTNFCTAYYLFYDGYVASDVKEVCITPWDNDEQEQTKKKQRTN